MTVAPAALGAMNFGTTTSKEAAFRVLDAYMDMGGNFIDTSNNYAHWAGTGDASDERIPADYIVGERLEVIRQMAREKGVNTSALVVAWMVNLYRCEGFPRVIPLLAYHAFGESKKEALADS